MKIYLIKKNDNKRILNLINSFNLQHDQNSSMALIINSEALELYDRKKPHQKSIKVNFLSKKNYYRMYHSKKKDILLKAVGIKKNYFPHVLDATAGLGNDAFILSFLGCKVIMIERHPIIAALLSDGLFRGYQDKTIGYWLKKRLNFIFNDSLTMMDLEIEKPDVIYLDPMYPMSKKQSLPKKNMQVLRNLIQQTCNIEKLFNIARKFAKKRIVIKRPCYSVPLFKKHMHFSIKGKNHRFDIYNPLL